MAYGYKKIHWTEHSKAKIKQYRLSKIKLISLIYNPQRKELGIAPGTVAVMKANKSYKTNKSYKINKSYSRHRKTLGEIWLMYKDNKNMRKIISAWRYPGISKPGENVPIPEDIRQELQNSNEF